LEALKGHEVLFDSKLGTYTGKKIHLDLKADVAPIIVNLSLFPSYMKKSFAMNANNYAMKAFWNLVVRLNMLILLLLFLKRMDESIGFLISVN
jgi:hypothetical protein